MLLSAFVIQYSCDFTPTFFDWCIPSARLSARIGPNSRVSLSLSNITTTTTFFRDRSPTIAQTSFTCRSTTSKCGVRATSLAHCSVSASHRDPPSRSIETRPRKPRHGPIVILAWLSSLSYPAGLPTWSAPGPPTRYRPYRIPRFQIRHVCARLLADSRTKLPTRAPGNGESHAHIIRPAVQPHISIPMETATTPMAAAPTLVTTFTLTLPPTPKPAHPRVDSAMTPRPRYRIVAPSSTLGIRRVPKTLVPQFCISAQMTCDSVDAVDESAACACA